VIPIPLGICVALSIALACSVGGYVQGRGDMALKCDAAAQEQHIQALNAEKADAELDTQQVVQYVEVVKEVPSPPVIRTRLVRVCDAAADTSTPVLDAAGISAASRAEAGNRKADDSGPSIEELATDLGACRRNTEKLRALADGFHARGAQ
jgi:hypothetical protein